MKEKMSCKIKRKWNLFQEWWNDDFDGWLSNGEVYSNAFFAGSGKTFWLYFLIFAIYGLITGQKLGFVKK